MKDSLLSKWALVSTCIITLLASAASLAGLFNNAPYALETENWRLQARGQDAGNLLGAIVLAASAVIARRGSVRAYLIWMGSLFYFLYAYIIYAVAVHFNSLFLVYVAVIGITLYTLIAALASRRLNLEVPEKSVRNLAGYTLIGIGVLFGLLWLGELIPALISGEVPNSLNEAGLLVNPIHVIDLSTVLPGFIAAGYLVSKNRPWGIFFAAPWLMFSVLMGSSIVAAMAMMSFSGFENVVPPMVMVSIVVLASLISLISFLQHMWMHIITPGRR